MGKLQVLGRSGHDTITWELGNETEVQAASDVFNELIRQKYTLIEVEEVDGKKHGKQRVEEFSPELNWVVAIPMVAGG